MSMTVLCATDFSPAADRSVRVAAKLATRTDGRLVLLHVLPGSVPGLEEADRLTAERAVATLETNASDLAAGASVTIRIERGAPAAVVPQVARAIGAAIIILAAGGRGPNRWIFGSTADRIAGATEVPLLAIREGFPVDAWLSGAQPLEVAIATDLSAISDHALRWAAGLSLYGPCRFTLMHVSWPEEAFHRLGIEGPLMLDRSHPAVEALVARELEAARTQLSASGPCEVVIEPPAKKAADAIVRLASERRTDLLVVGHQPSRGLRSWEGSVARRVVRSAPATVACVPAIEAAGDQPAPCPRRFLAATDLSNAGNAAVARALVMVPPEGSVTILHVIEEPEIDAARRQRIAEGLRHMGMDRTLTERRVDVRVELVESGDPAEAITRIAERDGADLICIASRGRSRLPRFLLGAVAQEVLLSSRIPVLVVPPPRT